MVGIRGSYNVPKQKRGRLNGEIKTSSTVVRSLLEILLEQGYSYREMGRIAGFGCNAPGRWRRGLGTPSTLTAECWAEALGVSLEVLTAEEKEFLKRFRKAKNGD